METQDLGFVEKAIVRAKEHCEKGKEHPREKALAEGIADFIFETIEEFEKRSDLPSNLVPEILDFISAGKGFLFEPMSLEKSLVSLEKYRSIQDRLGVFIDNGRYLRAGEYVSQAQRYIIDRIQPEDTPRVEKFIDDLEAKTFEIILNQASGAVKTALRNNPVVFQGPPPSRDILRPFFTASQLKVFQSYPNVEGSLISGEYSWGLFKNRSQGVPDLAGAVFYFFKAVEIFLWEAAKRNCSGGKFPVAWNRWVNIGSQEFDRVTLGNFSFFLAENPKDFLKEPMKGNSLSPRLRKWTNEVRNAHFHRDLVLSWEQAEFLKAETIAFLALLTEEIKSIP